VTTPTPSELLRRFARISLAKRALLIVAVMVNIYLLGIIIAGFFFSDVGFDWALYKEAGRRVFEGGLYSWPGTPYAFRYSPVSAYLFAALTPLGYLGWSLLHIASLAALPRRLAILALVTFPFWADVYNGNLTTFAVVAAVAALAGSRFGAVSLFALAVLAPRPLVLPVILWLLWKRPNLRLIFVAVFVIHLALVLASGWGGEWLASFSRSADDFAGRVDFGPARFIGVAWVPIGLALAAWLTWKGKLGLASLAASPYWLLHYFLMLMLDTGEVAMDREGAVACARSYGGAWIVARPSRTTKRRSTPAGTFPV
jgi:hypothetical protein